MSMEEEIIVSGYVQPVLDSLAYHGAHDLLDDVKRLDVYIYMGDLFAGGLKPNLFQVLEIYRSCFRRGCFRGVFQTPFWGVFQYRFSAPGDCFQGDSFSRGLEVGFTTKHRIYLSLTYIYIYI